MTHWRVIITLLLQFDMFLSTETVSILKNFASINQSILISPGNTLRSMSVMKNILVEARIEETFEKSVGIYLSLIHI